MLRRLFLSLVAAAWLTGCGLPALGGAMAESTPTVAPTMLPLPTGTPTPAAVDDTAEPPAMVEPPAATLTVDGQTQVAGLGTYCWTSGETGAGLGLCVDKMGVPTPRDPIQVNAVPFTAHFTFPLAEAPTSVSLTLIPVSAEVELTVEGTPDWRWWQFGEGQAVDVPLGVETDVELSPKPGLYALAVFTAWEGAGDVVYGFLVQVGEPETGGVAFTLPDACQPRDNLSPYVDPGGRYCLLFPPSFRIGDVTLNRANFYGPPLDLSPEPVLAVLSVSAAGPAVGRTLAQVVDSYVAVNGQGLPITRSPLSLAGEPAELVEGLPGRTPHWQIFLLHAGRVYQVSVFPKGDDFAQATPDVDAVWNAVSALLTFFE